MGHGGLVHHLIDLIIPQQVVRSMIQMIPVGDPLVHSGHALYWLLTFAFVT